MVPSLVPSGQQKSYRMGRWGKIGCFDLSREYCTGRMWPKFRVPLEGGRSIH